MKKLFKVLFCNLGGATSLIQYHCFRFGWLDRARKIYQFVLGWLCFHYHCLSWSVACTNYALKNDDPRKTFFSLSLFSVGRAGLIMTSSLVDYVC